MVLLLQVFWDPYLSASLDVLLTENFSRVTAIQVLMAICKCLRQFSKSATTHRFSSVVDKFADVVTKSVLPTMRQHISGSCHLSNAEEKYLLIKIASCKSFSWKV